MKRLFVCLSWMLWPMALLARDPAHVTLYCNSLQFAAASGGPGQTETLQLTSDSNFGEFNGELAPLFDPNEPSHGAYFTLDDPTFPDAIEGQIAFDKPPPLDANGNGFDDFFESSQEVASTKTQGLFVTPVDHGTVTAIWSRPAGAVTGTCTLQLTGQTFGRLPDFTHSFQLLEYSGTLNYLPASNAVTGTLQLVQTGSPTNTLTGAVSFVRVATNRFNQLTMQPASLTNAAGLSLTYQAADLERDEISHTNYFGFLDFADGDPTTGTIDFQDWVLSIDDLNDADNDGIPDLSDDPQTALAQPSLTLSRAPNGLSLGITGVPGSTYDLLEAISVVQTNWATSASITLTNSPQVVPLPAPPTSTRFWRLRSR